MGDLFLGFFWFFLSLISRFIFGVYFWDLFFGGFNFGACFWGFIFGSLFLGFVSGVYFGDEYPKNEKKNGKK